MGARMVGDTFVSWFDPTVVCEVVWDGRYLIPPDPDVPWPSSLHEGRSSRQPAKSSGKAGTPSGVVYQTVSGAAQR